MDEFAKTWALERRFAPEMAPEDRSARHARWQRAVAATMAV
jgi:glycerol kinase